MDALSHLKFLKAVLKIASASLACLFLCLSSSVFATTSSGSNKIPFERLEHGQYTIEVTINGVGPLNFMIDTAASRTSIFNKTSLRLGLEKNAVEHYINGITAASYRPSNTVETLSFARQTFFDHNIIVLKDWVDDQSPERLDGILGMDVLDGLVMTFSHNASTVKISKRSKISRSKRRRWAKISLTENPYPGQKFGLMFTYSKFGDLHIPTLLDTGSNFTAINWLSVKGTKIAKERRRLREEWVVQGSIDSFKPRMRIRIKELDIGGVKLDRHEFLLMDFENFPINNYGKYPLVIAGIDLFDGRDFILDFVEDAVYLAPEPENTKVIIGGQPSRIKTRRH